MKVSLHMSANVCSWTPKKHWPRILSEIKEDVVRTTLETAPDKRPWNKAQAIFLCTMRENAGLTKEKFDIKWVLAEIRVSVCKQFTYRAHVFSCTVVVQSSCH